MPDDEIDSDTDDNEEEHLVTKSLGDLFESEGGSDDEHDDDEDFEESNLIPDDHTSDSDTDSDGGDDQVQNHGWYNSTS